MAMKAFRKRFTRIGIGNRLPYFLLVPESKDKERVFTANLLVKIMDIDKDTAADIIRTLQKYSLIYTTQLEMDDEEQEIYTFNPTPSFIALLIFAREMIDRPNHFAYNIVNRKQPYL